MRKLLADTSISNNPKIIEELKKAGWKSTTAYRQEKGTRCYQFGVLYRFENSSVLKQTSSSKRVTDKQVTHYTTGKTAENKAFEAGSASPLPLIPNMLQFLIIMSSRVKLSPGSLHSGILII